MAKAEQMCSEILDVVQERKFATEETSRSMSDEEKGPYQFVFLQECDYMNALIYEMIRGLGELTLGFKGVLTMWWVKLGFPSTRPLRSWILNLKERCTQLED